MKKLKLAFAALIALVHFAASSTGLGPPISIDQDEGSRRIFVNSSIPIILLEKHHDHQSNTPRFRLEIFANGLGRYAGLRDVKRLGEVEFFLKPEQIKRIQEALDRAQFWSLPQIPSFVGSRSMGPLVLEVYARNETMDRRVYLTWGSPATSAIYLAVEKEVNSKQWRCPFATLTLPAEDCDWLDEYMKKSGDFTDPKKAR